ncbi:MAG: N-6 DNA methylase [Candidatus Tenebribacter davisii]|nr:N-6 DNA methylase [Candidatus Tenebribacter davisii]
MDRNTAKQLIENTFNYPFDEAKFRYFAINLLNDVDETKAFSYISGNYIKNSYKDHVTKYRRIGTYTDPDGDKIDVIIVHLKKEWALDRSRTMLRNFVADYLKNRDEKEAALVGYTTSDPEDWRFSYVRMEYKLEQTETGKIKVKEELTPAKRYSFLVGKNEPNHTAQAQLVDILVNDRKNPSLNDIETAFSVDAVTKQFYKDYRTHFEKIWHELDDIASKDIKIASELEIKSIDTANFAKKLMGQIVFLYFLQKKGWLGVIKDENGNFKEWGTGPKNFLHRLFKKEFTNYGNFFNDILEPLFYEALATERPKDFFSKFNCKIPFLNGGLFEPLNGYNWIETDICIDNDLIAEVFKTFDQYNFTVREDEPLEKEVAVDPEMLGKVFENLLPENMRKGKGAYYTPRTIVHYMCQESLINYLDTSINSPLERGETSQEVSGSVIPKDDIETFIREGDIILELETAIENGTKSYKSVLMDSIKDNAKKLDEALANIKVCDPAIGSGAFPVGMLTEIVKARKVLELYLSEKHTIYNLKRHCIQNSLYGVDIDPGAIDIAKLRLWLSLVVDEDDYTSIQPLPNLDYKIMQGNSLVEEFHGISLDIEKKDNEQLDVFSVDSDLDTFIDDLHKKQADFFNAEHPKDKENKRQEVESAIYNIFHNELEKKKNILPQEVKEIETDLREMTHGNKIRNFFPWKLYFADVFHEKGGFDIVIANPPYVGQKGNHKLFQVLKNHNNWKNFYERKQDLYYYFIAEGIKILNNVGIFSYIIPPYFTSAAAGKNLRQFIIDNSNILKILNLSEDFKVFSTVSINSIVLFINKRRRKKKITIDVPKSKKEFSAKFISYDSKYCTNDLDSNEWYLFKNQEIIEISIKNTLPLGLISHISPGIQSGCDKVSNLHITNFDIKNIKKNDGIFIISENEKDNLDFSLAENNFIKPCYKNSAINKYGLSHKGMCYMIITNRIIIIDNYPTIKKHLMKFKPILDDRYRNFALKNADRMGRWWYLYGYRPDTDFDNNKIVFPYRALKPTFHYLDKPFYSAMDVYYITNLRSDFSYKYILGILNSRLFKFFFEKNCKRKGKVIEFSMAPMKKVPIKIIDKVHQKPISKLVSKIISIVNENYNKPPKKGELAALCMKNDLMVYKLYELTYREVRIVDPETPFSQEEYEKFELEKAPENESIVEEIKTQTIPEVAVTSKKPVVIKPVPKKVEEPAVNILLEFTVGQHVIHPTFGEGEVQHVAGTGEQATIHVKFGKQTKKLVAGYAKLRGV